MMDIGRIDSLRLDNGLGVFVCQNRKSPVATFQAWIAAGSVSEGRLAGSGISHFLEHMVFKGTKSHARDQIASTMDSIGGRMNAYTSYCSTVFHADAPSSRIGTAADIVMELVMCPLFPEDEFAREKDVIVRERAMRSDSPDVVLAERLMRAMFVASPARHPIIGYASMIEAVGRQDIIEYHAAKYRPENVFMLVCGDVEPSAVFELVRRKCDGWENSSHYDEPVMQEPPQRSPREEMSTFSDPLCRLAVAFHSPPPSSPLSPALDVLGAILGGSESSRLARRVERGKELSVSIGAYHQALSFGGIFCASASAEPKKFANLREAVEEEIGAISGHEPPTRAELDRIVRQMSSDFVKSLRNIDSVAALVGRSLLHFSDPRYALRYLDQLKGMTPDNLAEAAHEFIRPELATTVKMLPPGLEHGVSSCEAPPSAEPARMRDLHRSPRTIFLPDRSLPVFDIVIMTKAGAILESSGTAGLSALLASCLSGGTSKRDEESVAEFLDENAIDLSINDGRNSLVLSLTAPSDRFDVSLEILGEMILSPSFPEAVVEREKQMEISSIESGRLSPRKALSELICRAFYGGHPYSNGSEEMLRAIPSFGRERLLEFYRTECLRAGDTVVAVSGDVPDEGLARFMELLGSIPWRGGSARIPPPPVPPRAPMALRASLPREQTVASLSFAACGAASPDRYAMDVAVSALNGMNSSLFRKIREEQGLAYYTGFSFFAGVGCGHASMYAGIEERNIDRTMDMFRAERERMIRDGALSDDEFLAAKEKILFHISETEANPRDNAVSALAEELLGNGLDAYRSNRQKYSSLAIDDVNSTVRKYLSNAPVEALVTPEEKK